MARDGTPTQSPKHKKVESLLSVTELKDRYLFGVTPVFSDVGEELSDETLQAYINIATSILEHELDLKITEEDIEEDKDYYANDYAEWGHFELNSIPVRSIDSLEVVYLQDENGADEIVQSIPMSWVRLTRHSGMVRLVPNGRSSSNLQIGADATFYPEIFSRNSQIPNMWRFRYKAGFADGQIPIAINTAIGLIASIFALNIAGDLVLDAGVGAKSISLDGLSQSISTTSSAENHSYSPKIIQYNKILFGQSVNSPDRGLIQSLRDTYQGLTMAII